MRLSQLSYQGRPVTVMFLPTTLKFLSQLFVSCAVSVKGKIVFLCLVGSKNSPSSPSVCRASLVVRLSPAKRRTGVKGHFQRFFFLKEGMMCNLFAWLKWCIGIKATTSNCFFLAAMLEVCVYWNIKWITQLVCLQRYIREKLPFLAQCFSKLKFLKVLNSDGVKKWKMSNKN